MKVIVKKTLGTFGHAVDGCIIARTHKSGPFIVSDEKGAELVKRGIVDVVEDEETAPAAVSEAPAKPAKKTGRPAKKTAPAAVSEAPALNPTAAVE